MTKVEGVLLATATWVNGQPGIRMELDGQLVGVVSLTVEGGRITHVYSIANPDKLGWLDDESTLSR
jgi:RNA polymerase sigma-70 factor (ECF subfamily)